MDQQHQQVFEDVQIDVRNKRSGAFDERARREFAYNVALGTKKPAQPKTPVSYSADSSFWSDASREFFHTNLPNQDIQDNQQDNQNQQAVHSGQEQQEAYSMQNHASMQQDQDLAVEQSRLMHQSADQSVSEKLLSIPMRVYNTVVGTIYDLLHFNDLPVQGQFAKVWWACTRDGRGIVWTVLIAAAALTVFIIVHVQQKKVAKRLSDLQSSSNANDLLLQLLAKR